MRTTKEILYTAEPVDVIVIGGGHAGCEAALAAARMGCTTTLFAMNMDSIAMMPCNPNIGGTSKGHLVREIDALGGEMGKNIDKTYIQSRMLNTGKGPAVHSLRAQADKQRYSQEMRRMLDATPNLQLVQSEVADIVVEGGIVTGAISVAGALYPCKAIVLATGTYLNGRCVWGEVSVNSGPNGLAPSLPLRDSLERLGITLYRFKTGTPARIDASTVDFSKMVEQNGDEEITPFSFENNRADIARSQISCYLTHTNERTHEIIRASLHRSPMYSGDIEGTATRYCPSIEDKVVRFAEKASHQVFVEPEGENTNELYVSGMSTSLPEDVQMAMYRSVVGLENSRIVRFGYAIEYDCIDATQLLPTLEFKAIRGLFSAGQFNGTSGYEEAAAQGLVAGINAAAGVLGKEPLTIDRSEGYVGVLIDDLVTKGSNEPYRMMTSRAEYRLLLRQDNADLRLTPKGYGYLIDENRYQKVLEKQRLINEEIRRLSKATIAPSDEINTLLKQHNSSEMTSGMKLIELVKRPELTYAVLADVDANRPALPEDVAEQVNIAIKYEGYIQKQMQQVEQFKKLEGRKLPQDLDYSTIDNLRLEARQKLNAIKPLNVGQASRITGVNPADVSNLLVYMERRKHMEKRADE
ncbi:MAG: tRNA uridine-5-carboxymethylaminomethyl(34) synthesis enzyme MnmG [Defluviitaleaceae bacterium]|nr:tRNA uridine-5-carboxymethylaminomethyl(34) synthesis enzyme MnmG [Defluviitaleaceae bacterium]